MVQLISVLVRLPFLPFVLQGRFLTRDRGPFCVDCRDAFIEENHGQDAYPPHTWGCYFKGHSGGLRH